LRWLKIYDNTTLSQLKEKVAKFRDNRNWKQFHNPKDLSIAISIEANELLELFLWIKEEKLEEVVNAKNDMICDEIADILIYCFSLCDILNIDISNIATSKLNKNEKKYPIDKRKGNAKKYTEI
jgi:NTP pyrophosphatase (non-canonical NTP hydrolase)